MSPVPGVIVLDADFLSAFLKIDRLPLVRSFFQVEELFVPPAVYREVSLTDLLPRLASISWILVQPPDATQARALWQDEDFAKLGPGEQEAIALSLSNLKTQCF